MFARDRDLLVLEPTLFRDVGWLSQRLLKTTGAIAGGVLTLDGGSFVAAGVSAGHVVLVGGAALEVMGVTSATTATMSLVRASAGGAAVAPVNTGAGVGVEVWTFTPQTAVVHAQLLRMIGIDPDVTSGAGPKQGEEVGVLTESAVLNPGALVQLEAMGALHLIYAAASAPMASAGGNVGVAGLRAAMYRQRFARERERTEAWIDLDGDGVAESSRKFNAVIGIRQ